MATHRRGSRPSQWPVRDLLGEQRSRVSELWDPRAAAAVAGLLACGAAVTVAFTVGDAGAPGRTDVSALDPAATSPTPPDPPALPVPAFPPGPPALPVPAFPPGPAATAPAVPSPPDPATPRAWRPPAADQPAAAPAHRRTRSVQEITDRLATELAAVQDGRLGGVLVMPVQREADATALVTATGRTSTTHRATKEKARGDATSPAAASDGGSGKQEDERRSGRADRDRADRDRADRDRADRDRADRDRDGHHDRRHCADGQPDHGDRDDEHRDDEHRDRKHHEHKHGHHDGQRDRAHEHEHDEQRDHAWGAAEWFGDDADQEDGGSATSDAAADEPAMAVLATRSHDGSGSDLTVHRLDSRALLTVLDDLEAADGAAPHARGA